MSFYFSYATSFDPAISYLTLAPDSKGQPPEKAKTYEVGAKTRWLDGLLQASVSAFRIDVANALTSDPDDPTVQEIPGSKQRVQGIELSLTGHLTPQWEISANYTYLDPKITASADPTEINKDLPNAARNLANLWTEYEVNDDWEVGTGVNVVGHRYADNANTANVPGYAIWNLQASYQATDYLKVQIDVYNVTDALYYTGSYYTDQTENHVLIGGGRSAALTLSTNF
jgi:catecholate siderophore receptor